MRNQQCLVYPLVICYSSPWKIDGPLIEIDGLANLIAWWIFPWRTVSHNMIGITPTYQRCQIDDVLQPWFHQISFISLFFCQRFFVRSHNQGLFLPTTAVIISFDVPYIPENSSPDGPSWVFSSTSSSDLAANDLMCDTLGCWKHSKLYVFSQGKKVGDWVGWCSKID